MFSKMAKWYKLSCTNTELQLLGTLNGGQSFRWENKSANEWIGVFANKVWVLQQFKDHLLYQVHESTIGNDEPLHKRIKTCNESEYETLLKDYFRLNICIKDLYAEWSEKDCYFKKAADQFYGIRILNQDVVENIFSFICSSNNNIKRISGMVNKLAELYGERICEIDGKVYYSFPAIDKLTGANVEKDLRDNGFGYRAKYISTSAKMIADAGGDLWLKKLKNMDYPDAKKSLMSLSGVGEKVADCICLMSLGHLEAVPVDTHIHQIAARLYMPNIAKQKFNSKIYAQISNHFRDLYGPLAGWAHTVLFCADLKNI